MLTSSRSPCNRAVTRVGDGFSLVIHHIFQQRGQHARATIGTSALALGVPTTVEATVALST